MRITDSAATRGKMRRTLRGWLWLGLPLLLLASPHATAQQEIRFGVLGLFHPRELILQPEGSQVLLVAAQGDAGNPALVLNGEPGHRQIVFRAEGDRVVAGDRSASSWTAAARDNGAVAFRLTVPGKFHRVYCARLAIQARKGQLLAVVAMDRETAVASIVAAEMAESSPMEALKAQAVVTRSFLTAGSRHLNFDFCDTTHCQFLKSPPPLTSRVTSAVQATQRLILAYRATRRETRTLITLYAANGAGGIQRPGKAKSAQAGSRPNRATSGEELPRRGSGAGARSRGATLRPQRTARAGCWKATARATAWACARWAQPAWRPRAPASARFSLIIIRTQS
jgi:hypothetical protein